MPNKNDDLLKLKNLKHGENCTVNFFEEGGGEVYRVWDAYILFYVPQYGGVASEYEGTYLKTQLEELVEKAYEWT